MLRIHFVQQWFGLSELAMEETLHDMASFREFAQLDAGATRLPDESTIFRFRHLLEVNNLASQILATVNAKLIEWNLLLKACTVVEMHQTKRGNQWHFGIKAHIGADDKSCLVHSVTGTATNEHDITQAHALLRGEENIVFADFGNRSITKREEIQAQHPEVD